MAKMRSEAYSIVDVRIHDMACEVYGSKRSRAMLKPLKPLFGRISIAIAAAVAVGKDTYLEETGSESCGHSCFSVCVERRGGG